MYSILQKINSQFFPPPFQFSALSGGIHRTLPPTLQGCRMGGLFFLRESWEPTECYPGSRISSVDFSWQKLLTLRLWSRYLKNSAHCIKWISCSSLQALYWSKKWGQSLWNLIKLSKSSVFAAKCLLPVPVVFLNTMPLVLFLNSEERNWL